MSEQDTSLSTEPDESRDEDEAKIVKRRGKAGWKDSKRHDVVLPSAMEVTIQIPNLLEMLRGGDIPNALVKFATKTVKKMNEDKAPTLEELRESSDFMRFLVVTTVKDPELTPEDVPDLPAEDVDMVLEFATRQRDLDALNRHIGGLHKIEDFYNFRGV